MPSPIFIISLPRSGSTLIQKTLTTHPEIRSASEPWILLPLFYMTKNDSVIAEYGHKTASIAIEQFLNSSDDLRTGARELLREYMSGIYKLAAGNSGRYFLDKTPRYFLIFEEVYKTFPDAKFIILKRNPLSVVSSCIETWNSGRWDVFDRNVDFFKGVEALVDIEKRFGDSDSCFFINYEDFVDDSESKFNMILSFLGLEQIDFELDGFRAVNFKGTMGDPTGVFSYDKISQDSKDKWKSSFIGYSRKRWAVRYLKWIGEERLGVLGYSFSEIMDNLEALPNFSKSMLSDLALTALSHGKLGLNYVSRIKRRVSSVAQKELWREPSLY